MSQHPKQFVGSRLKIKRAYRHIQELDDMFNAFLKSDFCRLVVDSDTEPGKQLVKLASVGAPPAEMSLVIGDAIHNLRAALDYTIVEILGERGHRAAFPMAKKRNNPGSHSTYRLIKETLPDLALVLVEKIQVHDTGDVCLWAIGALDNIDKHNLLIPVISVQCISNVSLEDKTRNNRFSFDRLAVRQGGVINAIAYQGSNLEVTSKGHPTAHILFGKGQPLEGKPIIQSLLKMAELATQAIQTLELFWFGKLPER